MSEENKAVLQDDDDADFFATGFTGRTQPDRPKKEYARRFNLKNEEDAMITFVDNTVTPTAFTYKNAKGVEITREISLPFMFSEHNMNIDGKWYNFFTCAAPVGKPCAACEAGNAPYQAMALTVIDHRAFDVEIDGKKVTKKDVKSLMVVKRNTPIFDIIYTKLHQKRGRDAQGLRGIRGEMSRGSQPTSAAVGSSFDFEDIVPVKAEIQPFNYPELLALIPYEDAKRRIQGGAESAARSGEKSRENKDTRRPEHMPSSAAADEDW